MPKIRVNTSELKRAESDIQNIHFKVKSIARDFRNVANDLDWDISSDIGVTRRVSKVNAAFEIQTKSIFRMKDFLGMAASKYDELENKNKQDNESKQNSKGIGKEIKKLITSMSKKLGLGGNIVASVISISDTIKAQDSVIQAGQDGILDKEAGVLIPKLMKEITGATKNIMNTADEAKKLKKFLVDNANGITKNASGKIKAFLGATKKAGKPVAAWEKSFGYNFKSKISWNKLDVPGLKDAKATKAAKAAKATWIFAAITKVFENIIEYNKKKNTEYKISKLRAISETVLETVLEVLKGAALTALAVAVLGPGAPAVIAAVAVGWGIDYICKQLTKGKNGEEDGKDLVEIVSDTVLDGVKSASKAVAGWWGRITNQSPAMGEESLSTAW